MKYTKKVFHKTNVLLECHYITKTLNIITINKCQKLSDVLHAIYGSMKTSKWGDPYRAARSHVFSRKMKTPFKVSQNCCFS